MYVMNEMNERINEIYESKLPPDLGHEFDASEFRGGNAGVVLRLLKGERRRGGRRRKSRG